ncbi:MAG: heme-copper oxidase subunit III [Chitinophagaceae bacterium]|nr:heme-copper oxidase subunit III [Chitinophagaceae bacterium]
MDTVMINDSQRKKMHPHKFTLWVGLGSIIMMFAGLTSAYIVKRDQPSWIAVDMPLTFWYSTAVILLSSLTVHTARAAFKERNMLKYRRLISVTVFLGLLFIVLQYVGFNQLWNSGLRMNGSGGVQFLYIIFGLHGLHVLGGIIALLVMFINAYSRRSRSYNMVPVEVASTYWHFVDILWIYLFVFFLVIK